MGKRYAASSSIYLTGDGRVIVQGRAVSPPTERDGNEAAAGG